MTEPTHVIVPIDGTSPTGGPAYEYKSFIREQDTIQNYKSASEVLNAEGAQGWELVNAVMFYNQQHGTWLEFFYLKRKTPATP